MGISITTRATFVIEVEHPSAWSPTETGKDLFDRGGKEAKHILQGLFDEQNTKHNTRYKIISHRTNSVVAEGTN